MPEIELVMNPEQAEIGSTALVRNGFPVYKVDGVEMELNYPEIRGALSTANGEAGARREALEVVAKHLGMAEHDIRKKEGLEAILGKLETFGAEQEELAGLRSSKAAGELDETAPDKIKAKAKTMNTERLAALAKSLEEEKLGRGQEKNRADAAVTALNNTQVVTALRTFHDKGKGFSDGSLETFLTVAKSPQEGGFRWKATNDINGAGIARLALTDDVGTTRKGPDGVADLTLDAWIEGGSLQTNHSTLFKQPQGSPPGVTPAGGAPNKNAADMSPAEVDAAARAVMA